MRVARSVFLSLLAVLALGVVSAASASAHEFYASKSGEIKNTGKTQKFTSDGKTVECKKESSTGKVEKGSAKTTVEKVKYSECSGPLGSTAEVSEGEDEFSAEGWVSILKTQTVKVKSLLGSCTVTTPEQKELKTVTYENNKGKLKVKVALKEIEWKSSGEPCGKEGTYKGKEGAEYSGEAEVELPEGELEWK